MNDIYRKKVKKYKYKYLKLKNNYITEGGGIDFDNITDIARSSGNYLVNIFGNIIPNNEKINNEENKLIEKINNEKNIVTLVTQLYYNEQLLINIQNRIKHLQSQINK
jgi:hypothetical protein